MKKVAKGVFLKLMLNILNKLKSYMSFIMIHHFYKKEWKFWKNQKVEKLVANVHDKKEYIIHMRSLKQALNDRIVLEMFHRDIKFNIKHS